MIISSASNNQGWPKSGFLKKKHWAGFFWVLLGFIGLFGVLLGFIDFSPPNYWVLLGFSWLLNEFWAVFDFCPFELFSILALFITRFYGVLWGFIWFLASF